MQFEAFRSQRRAGVLLAEPLGLLAIVEGLRDAVHLRGQLGFAEIAACNHGAETREVKFTKIRKAFSFHLQNSPTAIVLYPQVSHNAHIIVLKSDI